LDFHPNSDSYIDANSDPLGGRGCRSKIKDILAIVELIALVPVDPMIV